MQHDVLCSATVLCCSLSWYLAGVTVSQELLRAVEAGAWQSLAQRRVKHFGFEFRCAVPSHLNTHG